MKKPQKKDEGNCSYLISSENKMPVIFHGFCDPNRLSHLVNLLGLTKTKLHSRWDFISNPPERIVEMELSALKMSFEG